MGKPGISNAGNPPDRDICVCGIYDRSTNWIKCSELGCNSPWWHYECAGFKGLSKSDAKRFEWSCPACVVAKLNLSCIPVKEGEDMSSLNSGLVQSVAKEIFASLPNIVKSVVESFTPQGSYATAVKSTLINNRHSSSFEAKLMKKMVSQHTPDILKDKQEKNDRTCLIRQPCCLNIKNSRDIRREFNKLFPGMLIRNC